LNETSKKVCIGKNLSHTFPIQNGLKQRDALSPLLFNFVPVHVIRKVRECKVGQEINGKLQLIAYFDEIECRLNSGNAGLNG